jgi:hypothetical protein
MANRASDRGDKMMDDLIAYAAIAALAFAPYSIIGAWLYFRSGYCDLDKQSFREFVFVVLLWPFIFMSEM